MNKKLPIIMAAACVGAGVAANYDLLGRQISKSASPVVSKTDALKAKQSSVHHVLAKQSEAPVTLATGRLEQETWCEKRSKASQQTTYWFNDEEFGSLDAYLNKVNKYEASYSPRNNYNGSGEKQTKKDLALSFSTNRGKMLSVSGTDYLEKSRLEKNKTTTYKKLDIFSPWLFDLDYKYFSVVNTYKGTTGVYVVDDTAPNDAESKKLLNSCGKNNRSSRQDTQFGANQTAYTMGVYSYRPDIYYYDYECDQIKGKATQFPLKSTLDSKKIYMGVHTNGLNEYGDGQYNDRAAYLDDYIYETRMIEIVAEGNLGTNPNSGSWTGETRKTAAALNAITVGAVESATNKVAAYNGWKNPTYAKAVSGEKKGYDKPEIYGYTNYFMQNAYGYSIKNEKTGSVFEYTPTYDGTETAATYVGGIVNSLLSKEPFYRWHPEVVKALLLTSSDIDVMPKDKNGKIDYHNKKFEYKKDNSNLVLGATDYRKVFAGNHSRYWIANNFNEIKTGTEDGKPVLSFTERLPMFGGKFRVAIAWLSKSSDAIAAGRTPQDFDLTVLDSRGNVLAKSTTGDNPFELVEFSSEMSGEVTIKIKLYRNDGERVLLGYNMHHDGYFYQECTVGL